MAARPLTVLSLCSGVGGLDLGFRLAVPDSRVVCYVENETVNAVLLAARMADGSLDTAPVWDDLHTFDGRPWRGVVDCVVGGFPCQPWSAAGKQRGVEDDRWLWPAILRIIGVVRPRYVFLENVPGLVSGGGLELVLAGLAAEGWGDAEWLHLSAAAVGASHLRERVFILAVNEQAGGLADAAGHGRGEGWAEPAGEQRRPDAALGGGAVEHAARQPEREPDHAPRTVARCGAWPDAGGGCGPVGDAAGARQPGRGAGAGGAVWDGARGPQPSGRCDVVADTLGGGHAGWPPEPLRRPEARAAVAGTDTGVGRAVGDTDSAGLEVGVRGRGDGGAPCSACRAGAFLAGGLPLFPPGPGDAAGWAAVLRVRPDLAPALSINEAWELGLVEPLAQAKAQPALRRVASRIPQRLDRAGPNRADRLRALGNAVVPVQAATALRVLAERLGVADELEVDP